MPTLQQTDSHLLTLQVEAGADGEAMSTTSVSWSLSDELIQQMESRHYVSPHLVLIVASQEVEVDYHHYRPTKLYNIKLSSTKSPKKYIQFSSPGVNIVVATIVDVANPEDASELRRIVERKDVWLNQKGQLEKDGAIRYLSRLNIQTSQKVHVDPELFAPPPPKWLMKIVKMFFRTAEFDQCHFRRRAIVSLLSIIPVQIYGIFARLFTLVYALFAGKRGMSLSRLFALNPHSFAHGLEPSFWLYDKNGRRRNDKSIIPFLSPVAFIVYAFVLFALHVPGQIYAALNQIEGESELNHAIRVVLFSLAFDAALALVIGLFWLALSREGKRLVRSFARKSIRPVQADEMLYETLLQNHSARLSNHQDVPNIPDKTVTLKFHALKAKVCRPFAR